MRIQSMVDGFTPSEHAHAHLRWLLELAIKEVGCPPEALTELIIADADHFGEAIHQLSPGLPYTDNENFTAIAKTIRLRPEGRAADLRNRPARVHCERGAGCAGQRRREPERRGSTIHLYRVA